jgi:hypothetical protein
VGLNTAIELQVTGRLVSASPGKFSIVDWKTKATQLKTALTLIQTI